MYLTDDATGSLRIINFEDVKRPKEVARWELENPLARSVKTHEGEFTGGRYLHEVQVVDGMTVNNLLHYTGLPPGTPKPTCSVVLISGLIAPRTSAASL